MSDNLHRPEPGNQADDSQAADSRLLFARILERLDRLEKKLDSALNNRPRQWSGGQDHRRPGGSFNRPFKPNNGFGQRPGGPNRFEGQRRQHPGGHGKSFDHRP